MAYSPLPWPSPAATPPPEACLDNLTHTLVGAALARAGAERMTPLATVTLVVAANAPDIDVLSYARGEYFALSFRRGITHGLPALVVLALAVTGLVLAWDRWVRRPATPGAPPARAGPLLVLSALGVLTHPTLDWMNTYGMRWWVPFDGTWSYGDALFIIDPWIWLGLGGAVFLSSRGRRSGLIAWGALAAAATGLVVAAGGPGTALVWSCGLAGIVVAYRRRGPAPGRRPAAVAVGALAAYVVLLLAAGHVARSAVRSAALGAGLTVEDVMVAPLPGDPFRSEVEVRTADAFVPGRHAWLERPRVVLRPEAAVPLAAGPDGLDATRLDAVVRAARARPDVRDYLTWSRYPYVRVVGEGAGWRVTFSDARYDGRPGLGGLSGVQAWVADTEIR